MMTSNRCIFLYALAFPSLIGGCNGGDAGTGLQPCDGWDRSTVGESQPLVVKGPAVFARLEDDEGVQHVSVLEVLPEAIDATWSDVEAMDDETLLTFDTAEGPLRFVVRAALELPDQVVGQGVRLEASGTGLAVTREEDGGLLLALHRWSGEEEVEGEWVWNVPRTLDIGPVALETHPSCYVEDPCPRFYIFYDIIVVLQGAVAAEISPFEEADVVVDQAPYRVDVHGVHDRSGRGSIEGQTVECADLTPPAFDVDVIWLGET